MFAPKQHHPVDIIWWVPDNGTYSSFDLNKRNFFLTTEKNISTYL